MLAVGVPFQGAPSRSAPGPAPRLKQFKPTWKPLNLAELQLGS